MARNDRRLALEDAPRPRNAFISLAAVCCSIVLAAMSFAARGADPMREVLPLRKKIFEEAKKQGLAVSSHIFTGNSMGRDDWDVMFMDEFKNWAAFDGITAKYDAIASKIIGSEEKQVQMMTKRTETRKILGNKTMQELIVK